MRGYYIRSKGDFITSQTEVEVKHDRLSGVYPHTGSSQRGALGFPLLRRGPVSPNTVP